MKGVVKIEDELTPENLGLALYGMAIQKGRPGNGDLEGAIRDVLGESLLGHSERMFYEHSKAVRIHFGHVREPFAFLATHILGGRYVGIIYNKDEKAPLVAFMHSDEVPAEFAEHANKITADSKRTKYCIFYLDPKNELLKNLV